MSQKLGEVSFGNALTISATTLILYNFGKCIVYSDLQTKMTLASLVIFYQYWYNKTIDEVKNKKIDDALNVTNNIKDNALVNSKDDIGVNDALNVNDITKVSDSEIDSVQEKQLI